MGEETRSVPSVVHIITGLEVGGAERALYTLLTNGLEGRFRNRVISLMTPGHYGPLMREAGIAVTAVDMAPGRPTPGAIRRLMAAVAEAPADVFQGWMLHGNFAATLAWRLRGRRAALAWNQRNTPDAIRGDDRLGKRLQFRTGAWLSRRAQAIVYNSARSRQFHAQQGYDDRNATLIPNGFNTDIWRPDPDMRGKLRRDLGLREDARVIGYVGRGHPQKDLGNLFSAFERVSGKHPDAVLVTVGRDHEGYGTVSPRQIMLGQRGDVPELLRGFDLLCLSSRSEGFPNVLGEAMATGVPVVTTDVGDARALVGDTGWVAPPRSSEALAEQLDRALSLDPDSLRDHGRRARERIERDYSIASAVQAYDALYHRLTGGA